MGSGLATGVQGWEVGGNDPLSSSKGIARPASSNAAPPRPARLPQCHPQCRPLSQTGWGSDEAPTRAPAPACRDSHQELDGPRHSPSRPHSGPRPGTPGARGQVVGRDLRSHIYHMNLLLEREFHIKRGQ